MGRESPLFSPISKGGVLRLRALTIKESLGLRNGYGFREYMDILDDGTQANGLDIYVENENGEYDLYKELESDELIDMDMSDLTEDSIAEMSEDDFDTLVFELDLPSNWYKDNKESGETVKTMKDYDKEPEIEASCSAELMDQISFIGGE